MIPAIDVLIAAFARLEQENEGVVKSGRTHLQDATPIAFSQEISGWRTSLERDRELLKLAMEPLKELALGGTAVGTGLNAPKGFDTAVAAEVSRLTGKNFRTATQQVPRPDLQGRTGLCPRGIEGPGLRPDEDCQRYPLAGLRSPAGPGGDHHSGKRARFLHYARQGQPTQCEAVTMVAVQVMGNDTAVSMAASQGNFQLNVFMPVLIYNFLQSARLLAESMVSFHDHCVTGIRANREKMAGNLHNSLMLVTALNPYIGYENAAKTAKKAYAENISLKEACVALGFLTAERFDEVFHPEQMI